MTPLDDPGSRRRRGQWTSRVATEMFADTKSSSHLLPIKADVRRREKLGDGDIVALILTLER